MGLSELVVKVFAIGQGVYENQRDRKRFKQRSAGLKELSEKMILASSPGNKIAPQTERLTTKNNIGKKETPILALKEGESHPNPLLTVKKNVPAWTRRL